MVVSARDRLEVRLFGGFSLSYGGDALPPLPSRQARSLFAWLVMHPGRSQPRTALADRFWPDVAESRARRRLSHALWQIQDCLGEAAPGHGYLVTVADAVTFDDTSPYWSDVEEFEQRLDRVDDAGVVDEAGLRNLRRCVELFQGDLLAGSYEPWVMVEQQRLHQRYVNALGHMVDACKQRGNFTQALTFARRLTHQEPLREDAHREVMRLCVLLGQPSQALEQFERCRSVLAEELGTQPSAATLALWDRISETRDAGIARRDPVAHLISGRLVGRDAERVALVDQLERTLAGTAGTVFIEGEPGIGKTQLVAQLADDAHWRGFTVVWGACTDPEVAYGAIRDALVPELTPVRVAQLRAHVEPVWLRDAGQLLPPLAPDGNLPLDGAPASPLIGVRGADRMREALVRILRGLAAIEPVALVIEDVHHADHESLAFLQALTRGEPGRLLVVMTFRDVEVRETEEIWSALRHLDRDARPARIRLEPLSAFETAALLREVLGTADVPAEFTQAIHREGGGNPLYVLELLRALRDAGALTEGRRERFGNLTVPVTDGLRAVIGDRLDALDISARDVVRVGAVLGPEFSVDTLQLAGGHDQRELTTILGELVRRNVIEVAGGRCGFTHAATRRVVLARLDDDERRRLHQAAGGALEATHPGQVEALASHFRQAELPARALPYLRAAADRALKVHAYATAAGHLSAAASLSDQTPMAVGDRFELLAQLEAVLDVLGRRDEQAAVLDRLAALAGSDVACAVESSLRRAIHLGHVDRFADAIETAQQAVDQARRHDAVLHGRALTALGKVLGWAGQNEPAVEVLSEAADLLAEDATTAGHARFELGTALRFLQLFERSTRELQRALRRAETSDDQPGIVEALGALADVQAETAQTDEAINLYEQAIALARRIGYRHREGVSLVNLGTVRLVRGDPGPALLAYEEAAGVFDALGNHRGLAMVQLNRAWTLHRWLGRDDEAQRDAQSAHGYFEQSSNRGLAAVCLETLAGVARRRGQFDRAGDLLAAGLTAAREAGDQRAEVQLLRGQVELALERDAPDEAAGPLEIAMALVDRLGVTEFVADLSSLNALTLMSRGDGTEAWNASERAIDHVETSGEPHRIHRRVGLVAAAVGHEHVARQHHLAAYSLLMRSLEEVDDRGRATATDLVPEHRAIVAVGHAISPRTVEMPLAQQAAPRGRPLRSDETITANLLLGPQPASPDARREQLLQVLDQVQAQGADATVADLAAAFSVSSSTIRRDLRVLRSQGHEASTRGTATG